MDYTEPVERGVAWLDENAPADWWDRIDYDTLDLSEGSVCVLGQVFAAKADETGWIDGYHYAINEREFWGSGGCVDVTFHGFCTSFNYNQLREEWIYAIENRRALVNA